MMLRLFMSGTSAGTAAARTAMRAAGRAAGRAALNWAATMALLLRVACILASSDVLNPGVLDRPLQTANEGGGAGC